MAPEIAHCTLLVAHCSFWRKIPHLQVPGPNARSINQTVEASHELSVRSPGFCRPVPPKGATTSEIRRAKPGSLFHRQTQYRPRHRSNAGLDGRFRGRPVKTGMQRRQRFARALALRYTLRFHRAEPKHADGNLVRGATVFAKVFAAHGGLARDDVLLSQGFAETCAQAPDQPGVVVGRRS